MCLHVLTWAINKQSTQISYSEHCNTVLCTFISKLLKRVFMKQKPRNESQIVMKCNAILRHLFMMWHHRCKQHRVSVGNMIMANTELPFPEIPGVMRVTPAVVTLEVVGGRTLNSYTY